MAIERFRKTKPLSEELTDFIVTEILFDSEKKKMVNFVVLQLLQFKGRFFEVKKHDFSHGAYNYHNYFESLSHRKEIPEEILSDRLFWECKKDIQENWKGYRARYILKHFKRKELYNL